MDLLVLGHHGVAGERVVVLPASQLPNAAHGGVYRAQARTIALAPDHAFVESWRDLAPALRDATVGVEQELRVVQRAVVAFVDADGHHDASLFRGLANRVRDGTRNRHGLIDQLQVIRAHHRGRLDERKVGVIREDRFREHHEFRAFFRRFGDGRAHFFECALAAVQHRAELNGCRSHDLRSIHDGPPASLFRASRYRG